MKTPRIKTTRTSSRKPRKTQTIDPRLALQGKPLDFWLPHNENPLIRYIMSQWGDDLRHLPSRDGYYLIYWLIDQIIKKLPDCKPSDEAMEIFGRIGELSGEEMGRLIQAIMHRKKG
jgi:hypothetical protein